MMTKDKAKTKEQVLAEKREAEKKRYNNIKEDPVKYEEQQQKERLKYLRKKEKKRKPIAEMTSLEKIAKRKSWKKNSKNYRKNKKKKETVKNFLKDHSPPVSDSENGKNTSDPEPSAFYQQEVLHLQEEVRKETLLATRNRQRYSLAIKEKDNTIRKLKNKGEMYKKRYNRLKTTKQADVGSPNSKQPTKMNFNYDTLIKQELLNDEEDLLSPSPSSNINIQIKNEPISDDISSFVTVKNEHISDETVIKEGVTVKTEYQLTAPGDSFIIHELETPPSTYTQPTTQMLKNDKHVITETSLLSPQMQALTLPQHNQLIINTTPTTVKTHLQNATASKVTSSPPILLNSQLRKRYKVALPVNLKDKRTRYNIEGTTTALLTKQSVIADPMSSTKTLNKHRLLNTGSKKIINHLIKHKLNQSRNQKSPVIFDNRLQQESTEKSNPIIETNLNPISSPQIDQTTANTPQTKLVKQSVIADPMSSTNTLNKSRLLNTGSKKIINHLIKNKRNQSRNQKSPVIFDNLLQQESTKKSNPIIETNLNPISSPQIDQTTANTPQTKLVKQSVIADPMSSTNTLNKCRLLNTGSKKIINHVIKNKRNQSRNQKSPIIFDNHLQQKSNLIIETHLSPISSPQINQTTPNTPQTELNEMISTSSCLVASSKTENAFILAKETNDPPFISELRVKCLCSLTANSRNTSTNNSELRACFQEMLEETRRLSKKQQRQVKMSLLQAVSDAEELMEQGKCCGFL